MKCHFPGDNKIILGVFVFSLVAYGVSFLGFLFPWLNTAVFISLTVALISLVIFRPEYGIFALGLELTIGNKGLLFSVPVGQYAISIRHLIFGIVMLAWLVQLMRYRRIMLLTTPYRWFYLALGLVVVIGAVNGWFRNPHNVWFFDFNAYLFLLVGLPLFNVIRSGRIMRRLWSFMLGGMLAISIISIGISILFATAYFKPNIVKATQIDESQIQKLTDLGLTPDQARLAQTTNLASSKLRLNWSEVTPERPIIYRWLKDTGTAEVSYMGNRIFRVFMSSQAYIIFGLFILTASILYRRNISGLGRWPEIIIALTFGATLTLCFSRSFWLGILIGFAVFIFLLPKRTARRFLLTVLIILVLTLASIALTLPEVRSVIGERLASLFTPGSELAASNRLQLLLPVLGKIQERPILGSGFGTLVAFKALIPGTADVEYIKVYLYEWAYLDLIVKIGLIGLLCYLTWLGKILHIAIKARRTINEHRPLVDGIIAGLISLATLNVMTPYLNHPLGIGLVLFSAITVYQLYADVKAQA